MTADDEIADGVVRPPPVDARFGYIPVIERIHPLLTPVPKGRVEAAREQIRPVADTVIRTAREAPSRAVVHVVAKVDAVVMRRHTRHRRGRFDVVDAAAVPVVGAAEEKAK